MVVELTAKKWEEIKTWSRDRLIEERGIIEAEKSDIKGQIQQANSRSYLDGVKFDTGWMGRARSAYSYRVVYLNAINSRLVEINSERKKANIERSNTQTEFFKSAVIKSMKERLEPDLVDLILIRAYDIVSERMEEAGYGTKTV